MGSRSRGVHGLCAGALLLAHAASGCIISGDKCDANQVAYNDQVAVCLCKPGYVSDSDGTGCVPCGENQTSVQNVCVCKSGFSRASVNDTCKPQEQATACSSDADCAEATPYCVRRGSEAGYCTRTGCTSNAGCILGWTCEQGPSARYCAQPPTGFGQSCETSADCASFEASYCESLATHTCIIAGCATQERTCPNEWVCCDFSALIGSPFSFCASQSLLVQGGCPQGGTAVRP